MDFSNVSLTLYDFLGYLFPGYVVIVTCSLIESSFSNTGFFSLSQVQGNLIPYSVVAYFFGHVSHGLGSWIKARWPKWFSDEKWKLSDPLIEHACKTIQDSYGITSPPDTKLNLLEIYILADSYVTAAGGSSERDMWIAREGFFKSSMVSFGFLSMILFASLIVGGIRVQTDPGSFVQISQIPTGIFAALFLALTLLFRQRLNFHNRIKFNNTLLLFLALRKRDDTATAINS